ncbi:hypothetical protein GCM10009827_006270 [Dactylosporangium maewongense]|uniref:Uncharacterized protein n=1 Tax=Dactylosporangium maewongense TaxID=634393 RepID=A0ABN1ZKK6_9ACTN
MDAPLCRSFRLGAPPGCRFRLGAPPAPEPRASRRASVQKPKDPAGAVRILHPAVPARRRSDRAALPTAPPAPPLLDGAGIDAVIRYTRWQGNDVDHYP